MSDGAETNGAHAMGDDALLESILDEELDAEIENEIAHQPITERLAWRAERLLKSPSKTAQINGQLINFVLSKRPLPGESPEAKGNAVRLAMGALGFWESATWQNIQDIVMPSLRVTVPSTTDLVAAQRAYEAGQVKNRSWRKRKKQKTPVVDYYGPRGSLDQISADVRYAIVGNQLATLKPQMMDKDDLPHGSPPEQKCDGNGCPLYEAEPLSTFAALITEEVGLDDGVELTRAFSIAGAHSDGSMLAQTRVKAADFENLKWAVESWGARAVFRAGQGVRDKAREAIQLLSQPTRRHVYKHTGWRQLDDGRRVYLHAGGAIGADVVSVELGGKLANFVLPPHDPSIGAREAIAASLSILDVAPHTVTIPLLAATYLAPLSPFCPPDFMIWMTGRTGSMKSTLAALAMQHFGTAFTRTNLPIDWLSTATAIESALFALKDAVCVVDDFAPQVDRRRQQEMEKNAQWIIRSVGNRSSRSRMRHDLTQRPDRPPRGVVISTAEDLPPGQSTVARLVITRVERDKIDLVSLSAVQTQCALLAHAMRGYVEWIAAHYDVFAREAPAAHARHAATLRDQVLAHARQPEAYGHVLAGIEMLAQYAVGVRALDQAGAAKLRADALAAVLELGRHQEAVIVEQDPAERYVSALRSMLATQRAKLLIRSNEAGDDYRPGQSIGWKDDDFAYLDPEAARREVVQFYAASGGAFTTSKRALHEALARKQYIEAKQEGAETRYEHSARCAGAKRRVLKMPLAYLLDTSQDVDTSPIKPGDRPR